MSTRVSNRKSNADIFRAPACACHPDPQLVRPTLGPPAVPGHIDVDMGERPHRVPAVQRAADAKYHGLRVKLLLEGAEQAIPPGQVEAKVAVGFVVFH